MPVRLTIKRGAAGRLSRRLKYCSRTARCCGVGVASAPSAEPSALVRLRASVFRLIGSVIRKVLRSRKLVHGSDRPLLFARRASRQPAKKTQVLQALILNFLQHDPPGMFVIDSQGSMLANI